MNFGVVGVGGAFWDRGLEAGGASGLVVEGEVADGAVDGDEDEKIGGWFKEFFAGVVSWAMRTQVRKMPKIIRKAEKAQTITRRA